MLHVSRVAGISSQKQAIRAGASSHGFTLIKGPPGKRYLAMTSTPILSSAFDVWSAAKIRPAFLTSFRPDDDDTLFFRKSTPIVAGPCSRQILRMLDTHSRCIRGRREGRVDTFGGWHFLPKLNLRHYGRLRAHLKTGRTGRGVWRIAEFSLS